MTADGQSHSFGPYAFTLEPAEAEAAAARTGLRRALNGGLLASHVAPLTAFALIMAFASVLALTDLISRRAGEATILLAAARVHDPATGQSLADSQRAQRRASRDRAPSIRERRDGHVRR